MSGVRKAAILTLMVGETTAAAMFQHLNEDEIEAVAREVAVVGQISPESSSATLEEFHTMWRASEYVTRGGVDYAQKLLIKTLGPDMARRVLDRVVKSFESTVAFSNLERADPQQLSKFVLSEHPRRRAALAHSSRPGGSSRHSLPDELRFEVITGWRRSTKLAGSCPGLAFIGPSEGLGTGQLFVAAPRRRRLSTARCGVAPRCCRHRERSPDLLCRSNLSSSSTTCSTSTTTVARSSTRARRR